MYISNSKIQMFMKKTLVVNYRIYVIIKIQKIKGAFFFINQLYWTIGLRVQSV